MNKISKIIVLLLLFGMIISLNFTKIGDGDLFWHLKTGQEISETGIVSEDVYSWTFSGEDWLNHEWLTQYVFYLFSKDNNFLPLIIVKILFITATFGLLFYVILKKAGFIPATVFTGLGGLVAVRSFTVRPWIFSFFLIALLFFLLEKKKFYIIPMIFLFWINLHGLFVMGLFILFVEAMNELIVEKKYGLSKIFIISIIVMLINPNGLRGLLHPFSYLYGSTSIHLNYISEWQSPVFSGIWGMFFIIFIFISIFSFIYSKEKPKVKDVLLFFVFLAAGLMAARNVPIFVIITGVTASKSFARNDFSKNPVIIYISLALFTAVTVFSFEMDLKNFSNGSFINEEDYPVNAIDILEEENNRLVHTYRWGGYLLYHDIPVFIDGRADFYPGSFLEEYFRATGLNTDPEVFIQKYEIETILWEVEVPFFYYLKKSELWEMIFLDDTCAIFKRAGSRGKID